MTITLPLGKLGKALSGIGLIKEALRPTAVNLLTRLTGPATKIGIGTVLGGGQHNQQTM